MRSEWRGIFVLLACLSLFLGLFGRAAPGCADPARPADDRSGRTRGVRVLDPGDAMTPVAPFPAVTPGFLGRAASSLETMRVAVADGPAAELAGLGPRAAPFEIVAVAAHPDLVWNAKSGDASAGGTIVAYGVDRADLPAVIDRMATVRALTKEVAARPQGIELVSGRRESRKGDRIVIEVGNVGRRHLILFDIAGDGTVQVLYPLGGDERLVSTETFRWDFQMREPFGADLIVAVSSEKPLDALEHGLKDISRHRGAGEVMKLLALAAPPDARIGMIALRTLP